MCAAASAGEVFPMSFDVSGIEAAAHALLDADPRCCRPPGRWLMAAARSAQSRDRGEGRRGLWKQDYDADIR
jgi:hypothetical protein